MHPPRDAPHGRHTVTPPPLTAHLDEVDRLLRRLALAVTLAPVAAGRRALFAWVATVLLASMSPLWTRREKALLIGLVPVGWVLGAVPGRFNGGDLVITGAVGSTALFARVLPRLVLRGRSRG